MLEIKIGGEEQFNEETETFFTPDVAELKLEHSLVSLSKWESKWELPFLSSREKTSEQVLDYIRQMIIGPEPAPEVFATITDSNINEIHKYIRAEMTATRIFETKKPKGPQETITAELIYYWMIAHNIPFECQFWHLNKLLTLIKVCNIKNSPKKKLSFAEMAQKQRDLNAQRRAEFGTNG